MVAQKLKLVSINTCLPPHFKEIFARRLRQFYSSTSPLLDYYNSQPTPLFQGSKAKVVYHYGKPYDMEKAERIVLKGKMNGDVFEITQKDGILIKCPSKYKDDPEAAKKSLSKTQE